MARKKENSAEIAGGKPHVKKREKVERQIVVSPLGRDLPPETCLE